MPAVSDWRSPEEYEDCRHLDRPGFSWEFLRRNSTYQQDYEAIVRGSTSDAGRGGSTIEAFARRWGVTFPSRSTTYREPGGRILAARNIPCDTRVGAGAGLLLRCLAV
jgi:hypothetical protein